MGPAANQPALLIIEVREFHLQTPLGRGRPFAENLEDQASPVDHLAFEFFLKVPLLDSA